MTASTIRNKAAKILKIALPVIFWLSVYELLAFTLVLIIDTSAYLPHLNDVAYALFGLLSDGSFYLVCALTLLRVIAALTLGIILGVLLGILSAKFKTIYHIMNPFMSVVKATPVASFIIALWVLLSGNVLVIMIATFMVMPIIWQSTYNSFDMLDRGLVEVGEMFEFSPKYRFKVLYLPSLKKYLVPSVITSVGLAWKSEVAAEIIAYTTSSIGQLINDAKYENEYPMVFAWTFVIIIFSILFETLTKHLFRRIKI